MLALLKEVVSNVKASSQSSKTLIPMRLVEFLEVDDRSEIGKFMLECRAQSISFDFEKQPVNSALSAYDLVRAANTVSEEIYYALCYVSKMHRITQRTVKSILSDNL